MKSPLLLVITLSLLLPINANAFRKNSLQSQQTKTQKFEWPGRYNCEQCTGNGSKDCWKYELTIYRDETERRGQVLVNGPGENIALKALVSGDSTQVEFRYTEAVDTTTKSPPFKRDDVLIDLQHNDDDLTLRFKKLTTKVAKQTAITCTKS